MEGQAEGRGTTQPAPSSVPETNLPRLLEAQYASFGEDLPFWLTLAARFRGPILELGCGPGRVLSALSNAGHDVDGLDHDPEMLRRAAKRVSPEPGRVRLIEGDLRHLELDRDYGLILLPCNTFATLDRPAAEATLAEIHDHLLPGGLFATEVPAPREEEASDVDPAEPLDAFIEPETGHMIQLYAEQQWEPEQHMVRVTWCYDELLPDGQVIRARVPTLVHLWSAQGLGEAARRAGFSSYEAFGDYDFQPFSVDSPRFLFTAHV